MLVSFRDVETPSRRFKEIVGGELVKLLPPLVLKTTKMVRIGKHYIKKKVHYSYYLYVRPFFEPVDAAVYSIIQRNYTPSRSFNHESIFWPS